MEILKGYSIRKLEDNAMGPELSQLGSSLSVPCVQELAKEPLTKVPSRYLRPDEDCPIISDASPLPQIPAVDMQKLISQEFMDSELDKLHLACKNWGFFQVFTCIEQISSE